MSSVHFCRDSCEMSAGKWLHYRILFTCAAEVRRLGGGQRPASVCKVYAWPRPNLGVQSNNSQPNSFAPFPEVKRRRIPPPVDRICSLLLWPHFPSPSLSCTACQQQGSFFYYLKKDSFLRFYGFATATVVTGSRFIWVEIKLYFLFRCIWSAKTFGQSILH